MCELSTQRVSLHEYDAQSWFQLSCVAAHLKDDELGEMAYMRAWQFGKPLPLHIIPFFLWFLIHGACLSPFCTIYLSICPHTTQAIDGLDRRGLWGSDEVPSRFCCNYPTLE